MEKYWNIPFRTSGNAMELSYIELLSPEPFQIKNVGSLKRLSVREVSSRYDTYQFYISLLLLTPETILEQQDMHVSDVSDLVQNPEKPHIFDLLLCDENLLVLMENALDFFFLDKVRFDFERNVFLTFNGTRDKDEAMIPTGIIGKENWISLCSVILQMNYVDSKWEDTDKAKGEKARKVLEKLNDGRKKLMAAKADKEQEQMNFGNIVSAVAAKSPNLNIHDIWNITIYQLWDSFIRLRINLIYEIESTGISVWGNKEKNFDFSGWYKNILEK